MAGWLACLISSHNCSVTRVVLKVDFFSEAILHRLRKFHPYFPSGIMTFLVPTQCSEILFFQPPHLLMRSWLALWPPSYFSLVPRPQLGSLTHIMLRPLSIPNPHSIQRPHPSFLALSLVLHFPVCKPVLRSSCLNPTEFSDPDLPCLFHFAASASCPHPILRQRFLRHVQS